MAAAAAAAAASSDEVKICLFPGCDRRATLSDKPDGVAFVCHVHRKFKNLGLVKVTTLAPLRYNLCAAKLEGGEPCTSVASFGKPGTTRRLFCGVHKLDGCVNLNVTTCTATKEDGQPCTNAAYFGPPGAAEPLFCGAHKGDDGTNVHLGAVKPEGGKRGGGRKREGGSDDGKSEKIRRGRAS